MTGMAGNGWKWQEMAKNRLNDWKWLKMARNSSNDWNVGNG